ncbi:MAG: DUF2207 domain-containing protein, partial [Halioglobus sp.]|nr:DUF2207 domain-containing protein [Halioglobus sp.]
MRRLLQTLLCALLALVAGPGIAGERILSFDSEIVVDHDGGMRVTETLTVVAEGAEIRRGIYREFPLHYRDRYGNRYTVNFEVLDVTRDGRQEPWHTENRANGVRIYAGDADTLLAPGIYTYSMTYRTDRQLGFFEDHDELYWNVTGNGWRFRIERAQAVVRLPDAVPAANLSLAAYTGVEGERGGHYQLDLSDGVGRVATTRALESGEGLTLVLGWPKGVVREPSRWQRLVHTLQDNLGLLLSMLAFAGSALWLLLMWFRYGRDPRPGVVFPRYEPPAGYSPASTRYIRKMHYDNGVFTAAIIQLAVKGYLSIEKAGRAYTLRRQQADATLAAGEAVILDKLFAGGSELPLEKSQHARLSAARSAHRKVLRKDYLNRYFSTNGGLLLPSIAAVLVLLAVILVAGAFVPLVAAIFAAVGLMHGVFAWLLRAPSRRGRALLDQLDGFKLYLEVAEKDALALRHPPEKTPELFEKYLPFAFALGVEQAWAEQFSEIFAGLQGKAGVAYSPRWYAGDFDTRHMS